MLNLLTKADIISYTAVLLLICLLAFTFWNWLTLRKISRDIKKKSKPNSHAEFFDLKARLELFAAIGAIVIFFVTFFGFANINDVEDSLAQKFDPLRNELQVAEGKVKQLTQILNRATKNNIIKHPIYIIDSVEFKHREEDYPIRYFSDYRTIDGEELPNFEVAPMVIATPISGVFPDIFNVSELSFQISWGSAVPDADQLEKSYFTLLVVEKKP